MTLLEFIEARIAEDEALAADWEGLLDEPSETAGVVSDCDCGEDHAYSSYLAVAPRRWLAECAAKRHLITEVFAVAARIDGERGCCHSAESLRDLARMGWNSDDCHGIDTAQPFLAALALPYTHHPDYRQEWRP